MSQLATVHRKTNMTTNETTAQMAASYYSKANNNEISSHLYDGLNVCVLVSECWALWVHVQDATLPISWWSIMMWSCWVQAKYANTKTSSNAGRNAISVLLKFITRFMWRSKVPQEIYEKISELRPFTQISRAFRPNCRMIAINFGPFNLYLSRYHRNQRRQNFEKGKKWNENTKYFERKLRSSSVLSDTIRYYEDTTENRKLVIIDITGV